MSNLRIERKKEKNKEKMEKLALKNVQELKKVKYTELKVVEPIVIESVDTNTVPASIEVNEVEIKREEIKEIVKEVEVEKTVKNFEVNIDEQMAKQMSDLNSMRAIREENLGTYVNQQLKTLIQRFDDQYDRLEKNLDAITDFKNRNELNGNLKMAKKMWEKSLQELKNQKRDLEKNLMDNKEKIEKDRAKELNVIEKDYLTSQLFTKKDLISQKYRDELNVKISEIQTSIELPQKSYDLAKMELEILTKKFNEVKLNIEDKEDDKLYETIKSRKGDKTFTEIRVMIPEAKKEELSKLVMEFGYIPESFMKDFERLSEKDVLINENEKSKANQINEKYLIYKDAAEQLQTTILNNKEMLDKADEVKKLVIGQYNEKVTDLNKNLSQISKDNELKKVEKIKTIKVDDVYSENVTKSSEKAVGFAVEKAPKKENFFTRVVNSIKESSIFKALSDRKVEKNKIKEAKEEEGRKNELNSLIESKSQLKSLRASLVGMVNEDSSIGSFANNTMKYKEIDLLTK
jgi:hypothetical protein